MKKIHYLFFFIIISCSKTKENSSFDFTTKFEKSLGTETTTYSETIEFYENLAATYPEISLIEMGKTDSNLPLHIVVFNSSKEFDFSKIKKGNKNIILINNGIHPGESDGIDASMLLLRDIVQDKNKIKQLENIVLAVIPIYNIGGPLNRNSTSRTNQNGPKEYGFRGNARNFDLNRDFIKADTKNARSFAQIFHLVNPDIFIGNHVGNGADYQYGITHLFTQHNKLGNDLGEFIENTMRPSIEASLLKKDIHITPYVSVWGKTPDKGFSQFFDSPRYSSGYTTLFNTLGLMIETHMLKPYKQRVEQTYSLIQSAIEFSIAKGNKIKKLRKNAVQKIIDNYMHSNTEIKTIQKITYFKKGDIYIPTTQNGIRYIIETLEASAADSFFNWIFFDTILQQKEGYSGYVFEDIAEELLINNPKIKDSLLQKMADNKNFAKNPRAQLDFIYKNSPHYEKIHLKLPVYKVY